MYPRHCTIVNKDGTFFSRAASLWVLIDQKLRQPISPKDSGITLPSSQNIEPPLKLSFKQRFVEGFGLKSCYSPQYCDIDFMAM